MPIGVASIELPELLDGPPCAVLTCNQAGTVTIRGWTVCTGHDPRSPYDRARDGLDDVLDGRAK